MIGKRSHRVVPLAPGGTLIDYVAFYLTPSSPMLLNIKTGVNVRRLPMDEVAIFVSSLDSLREQAVPFVLTDRHAYLDAARFSSDQPLKAAGGHWYCDIAAVRFRKPETVFLCEVTYAKTPKALFNRLLAWDAHWMAVRAALAHDNGVPEAWPVRPWAFVRGDRRAFVERRLAELLGSRGEADRMPEPLVTSLDDVAPWRYVLPLREGRCTG